MDWFFHLLVFLNIKGWPKPLRRAFWFAAPVTIPVYAALWLLILIGVGLLVFVLTFIDAHRSQQGASLR